MISFWVSIIFITFFVIGLIIYKRWFNPIFLYIGSWSLILYTYDLSLMSFTSVSEFTWITILFAFISFLFGCFIVYLARSVFFDNHAIINNKEETYIPWSEQKIKKLRRMIIITAVLGFLVSLQHWYVLLEEFGSIPMVLLQAQDIYRMRVEGEHFGKIPYIVLLSYVSVFLSALYSAYRNKFTYLVTIPLIAVILTDAASLARAGVFFSLMIFGITFMTARFYFKTKSGDVRYSNNKNLIITVFVVLVLALGSVQIIRVVRNPLAGEYKPTTTKLKELDRDGILSTSIYLYFSSPIPVLSKYLDNRDEVAIFGENTFHPIYRNLNKFGAEVNLQAYPTGYFVPMWVNSATYIRELDVDFGLIGILIVPFVIGFLSTLFWFKYFQNGSLIYLTLYTFTSVIIIFSVFYIGTRLSFWMFSFIFSIIAIIFFDKPNNKILAKNSEE